MYEAHWDYFNPSQYAQQPQVIEHMDLNQRNRMATLFWYLNDVPDGGGGHTFFPRAVDDQVRWLTHMRRGQTMVSVHQERAAMLPHLILNVGKC